MAPDRYRRSPGDTAARDMLGRDPDRARAGFQEAVREGRVSQGEDGALVVDGGPDDGPRSVAQPMPPTKPPATPLEAEIASGLVRIENNYAREGTGCGSRFEGELLEVVQARWAIMIARFNANAAEMIALRAAAYAVAAARNSGDGSVESFHIDALTDAAFGVLNATGKT